MIEIVKENEMLFLETGADPAQDFGGVLLSFSCEKFSKQKKTASIVTHSNWNGLDMKYKTLLASKT